MHKRNIILLILCFIILVSCENKQEKNEIVVYGDYKCPYCKKVETDIMPKLKKDYIDKDKVNYQFVNMAFLGNDSIKGARAGHAVYNNAPNQYLKFQKLMFDQQPNHENQWITVKLIDEQINKLHISDEQSQKIKKDYKTKNSKAWKDTQKDQKRYKDNDVREAPTVFINGKKIKNVYDYKEYKKHLE